MRIAIIAAFTAFIFAADAHAEPTLADALPGQSIEDVIAALPDTDWRYFWDENQETLQGAVGSGAIQIDGWRWTLRLGRTMATEPSTFAYSFEANSSRRFDTRDECAAAVSQTIASLEPSLGAYSPGDIYRVYPDYIAGASVSAPTEAAAGHASRTNTYRQEHRQHIIGMREVQMGAATFAYIAGINVRSRTMNGWGYDCYLSIGFKAPAAVTE